MEIAKEDLHDQSCTVLIVTFGNKEGARRWISETKCSYPVVIDEERNFYKLLGLNRSTKKSSNTSAISFYGAAFARGETPPSRFDNDDYHQMGGNFVVTSSPSTSSSMMKLTYIHPSQTATDRPTIPFLIRHVTKLNKS